MRLKVAATFLALGVLIGIVLPVSAHHSNSLDALKRRVATLEKRTQNLNKNGFYLSFIDGFQVLSYQYCPNNVDAIWEETQEPEFTQLGCAEGASLDVNLKALRKYVKNR